MPYVREGCGVPLRHITLGEALRDQRRRRDLNLREAAREINVSALTLSRIERGDIPSLIVYTKIVVWLGAPKLSLVYDTNGTLSCVVAPVIEVGR
jgi:transcriptional regulator with XRE-family HTH domain